MTIRSFILRLHWLFAVQFGVNLVTMGRSLRGIPRYVRDLQRFRSIYSGPLEIVPCLHDWYEEAGSTQSEYFWQDLIVARMIFEAAPVKHVDVGSRIDGFVSHVACFRELEVLDVRPVTRPIPGISFRQVDLTRPEGLHPGYCDSLSCLHALEHFGLGRYGDKIDPKGLERGLANLSSLLSEAGVLYLSIPIGQERVEFNANRVCNPETILGFARGKSLFLTSLTLVTHDGATVEIGIDDPTFVELAKQRYALGIFRFIKRSAESFTPSGA
jgi:hypothetical protein